ncbi:conserved hypothetical protein [Trichinella spiralis]|uniref:hypothetical protein n=1 Tax=Trichinella spiralis TaxID=6334 RepID=UPI0001EFE2E4|nr:conserved hypothetical protein [Trichinella spiralis]
MRRQDATFRVAYPTYVSRRLPLRAQCLSFMQIGRRRCAANEQRRFQYDDRRRRTIKTALYRRIEDENGRPRGRGCLLIRWLSAFERFHVPCLVELSLGFICGK